MPCGCGKKMDEPSGLFNMKYVGRPGGALIRGAPLYHEGGEYEQGKIYLQPFGNSRDPWWELAEEVPVVKAPIPSLEESVFTKLNPAISDFDGKQEEADPDELPEDILSELKASGDGFVGGEPEPAEKRRKRKAKGDGPA